MKASLLNDPNRVGDSMQTAHVCDRDVVCVLCSNVAMR